MRKMKDKVRKRKVNWSNVVFGLHRKSLSDELKQFVGDHPYMSRNRCAYYVLKKNYSTTLIKLWRENILFGLADEYNVEQYTHHVVECEWL